MHITLYQALKSVKIGDEQAAKVVGTLEEFIAVKIEDANKGLEAELRSIKWLLSFIGTILAIIGLAPFLAKLF